MVASPVQEEENFGVRKRLKRSTSHRTIKKFQVGNLVASPMIERRPHKRSFTQKSPEKRASEEPMNPEASSLETRDARRRLLLVPGSRLRAAAGVTKVVSGYSGGDVRIRPINRCAAVAPDTPRSCRFASIQRSSRSAKSWKCSSPSTIRRRSIGRARTSARSTVRHLLPFAGAEAGRGGPIAELNAAQIWDRPLVTQVVPFETFWPAEEYHQGYFRDNPGQGYCQAVVSPKVAKFRKKFLGRLQRVVQSPKSKVEDGRFAVFDFEFGLRPSDLFYPTAMPTRTS